MSHGQEQDRTLFTFLDYVGLALILMPVEEVGRRFLEGHTISIRGWIVACISLFLGALVLYVSKWSNSLQEGLVKALRRAPLSNDRMPMHLRFRGDAGRLTLILAPLIVVISFMVLMWKVSPTEKALQVENVRPDRDNRPFLSIPRAMMPAYLEQMKEALTASLPSGVKTCHAIIFSKPQSEKASSVTVQIKALLEAKGWIVERGVTGNRSFKGDADIVATSNNQSKLCSVTLAQMMATFPSFAFGFQDNQTSYELSLCPECIEILIGEYDASLSKLSDRNQ
ncbi:hypothetical protein [Bradyrhizobium sp. SRS-191]|uniref:hypothetical protein n=1 Tax=Bradyrhizobium sp. SRS-191 TaxID=2962606 RepID=UPI00211DE5F3|nr:hypothetical protein [Bradyrhizobium sp. SRS-191]